MIVRTHFWSGRSAAWLLLLIVVATFTGCWGSQDQSAATEQSNLKPLAILYGRYLGQHRGQPPANEDEFKKFVNGMSADELAAVGVSKVSEIFISGRDNQPYVIIYGPPSGPPGPAGSPVIAYEQTGQGGVRFVASSLGAVEQVTEERFRELVPNAK